MADPNQTLKNNFPRMDFTSITTYGSKPSKYSMTPQSAERHMKDNSKSIIKIKGVTVEQKGACFRSVESALIQAKRELVLRLEEIDMILKAKKEVDKIIKN